MNLPDLDGDPWETGKSTLHQWYDKVQPGWDAPPPPITYRIFSAADITWCERIVLTNRPFRCHLCDADDKWVPESIGGVVAVFVCKHEAIDPLLPIPKISSVKASLVGRHEVAHEL